MLLGQFLGQEEEFEIGLCAGHHSRFYGFGLHISGQLGVHLDRVDGYIGGEQAPRHGMSLSCHRLSKDGGAGDELVSSVIR